MIENRKQASMSVGFTTGELDSVGSIAVREVLRARTCPLCKQRLLHWPDRYDGEQIFELRFSAGLTDCAVHYLIKRITFASGDGMAILAAVDLLCDPEKARAYATLVKLTGEEGAYQELSNEIGCAERNRDASGDVNVSEL